MAKVDNIKIYVVDIGQGQLNYIECLEGDKIRHTMIMDAGTTRGSELSEKKNIEFISERIMTMEKPKIDVIILSHGDRDHYNRLVDILIPCKDKVKVGNVWYGGAADRYEISLEQRIALGYKGSYLLTMLEEKFGAYVISPSPNYTNWSSFTNDFGFPIWVSSSFEVMVFILVANVPKEEVSGEKRKRKETAEELNQVSVVANVRFSINGAKRNFIICGDATLCTFASTNKIMGGSNLSDVKMATVPHHGSRKTAYGLKTAKDEPSSQNALTVQTFSTKLNAETYTVSAFKSHGHPFLSILNAFKPVSVTPWIEDTRIKNANKRHLFVVHKDIGLKIDADPVAGEFITLASTSNTFATWYAQDGSLGECTYSLNKLNSTVATSPPTELEANKVMSDHASWIYSVNSQAEVSLEGMVTLKSDEPFTRPASVLLLKKEKAANRQLDSSPIEVRRVRQMIAMPAASSTPQHSRLTHFH